MVHFQSYISELQNLLERIKCEQTAAIEAAGQLVADALVGDGLIHTFGTGHSHLIADEAFFRAGGIAAINPILDERLVFLKGALESTRTDRKSTRLNSSHGYISYAVFCLNKKK